MKRNKITGEELIIARKTAEKIKDKIDMALGCTYRKDVIGHLTSAQNMSVCLQSSIQLYCSGCCVFSRVGEEHTGVCHHHNIFTSASGLACGNYDDIN